MDELKVSIANAKKTLGKRLPCSIEILTPVHIGSGVRLTEGVDFYSDNNATTIIPQSVFFEYLQNHPEDISKFDDPNFKPTSILSNISDGRKYYIKCRSRNIYQFERNGNGIPYIPGSSTKGALRTMILKYFFNRLTLVEQEELVENIRGGNDRKASEPVLDELFGANERHNYLRVVLPGDADFSEQSIDLKTVYILNLQTNEATQYGWKNMKKKEHGGGTFKEFSNATPIFVEMLDIGARGNFTIKIDDFLFNDDKAKEELRFDAKRLTLTDIAKVINRYSEESLKNEIQFFEKFNNKELNELITQLKIIKSMIPHGDTEQETKEFLLRLSWGTGWKTMTGDYLPEKQLQRIKQLYGLGSNHFSVFPKTRKIVVEDKTPKYPCGWVKIRLNDTFIDPQKTSKNVDKIQKTGWEALEEKGIRITKNKKK